MSVFSLYLIKTRLNFTANFYTKITPNLNISARMSWSISEKFEAVEKYRSWVLSSLKIRGVALSF